VIEIFQSPDQISLL